MYVSWKSVFYPASAETLAFWARRCFSYCLYCNHFEKETQEQLSGETLWVGIQSTSGTPHRGTETPKNFMPLYNC